MSEPAWLRHGRLLLVGLHLFAITAMGLPTPTGARSARTWKDPALKAQIAGWLGPAKALGLADDEETLTARLKAVSLALLDLRDAVTDPLKPYGRCCGTWQGWQMFGSVNPDPARLRVQIQDRPSAEWRTLYLARDPEAAWRSRLLDSERGRAIANDWSWGRGRSDYALFGAWLARLAAADFPAAHAIRVTMIVGHIPDPAALRAGEAWVERARWEETFPLRRSP